MRKTVSSILLILFFALEACLQDGKESREKFKNALQLYDAGRYEEVIKHLDSILVTYPNNDAVLCLKGRSLFNLGDEEAAIKVMNEAIRLNPEYYSAIGYRAIMKSLLPNPEFEDVMNDFSVALAHDADNIGLIKSKVGFLMKSNHFDEALKESLDIIRKTPSDFVVMNIQATCLAKLGKYQESLEVLNQIAEMDSGQYYYVLDTRAFVHLSLQNFEQAINDYNRLLALIENDTSMFQTKAYSYNNRGYSKFRAGYIQAALDDINYSIKLLPTNSYAFKNRAEVFLYQGKIEECCADLRLAKSLGYSGQYGDEVDIMIRNNCGEKRAATSSENP